MSELFSLDELKTRLPETKSAPSGPGILTEPEKIEPEEAETVEPVEPVVTPEPSTPPMASGLKPLNELKNRLPEQTTTEKVKEAVGEAAEGVVGTAIEAGEDLLKTAYDRLLGVDVSDPLAVERLVFSSYYGMLGGEAGARVPGPPWLKAITTLGGGIAGVAGGSGVPEVYFNTLEAAGIIPPGSARKMSLSAPELKELIMGEVLLEVATMGGASALRLGGRLTGQLFTGITKEGRRIAEMSHKLGINLMPVQVGDRIIGKGYVAVAGKFPLIGRPIYSQGLRTERAFQKQVEEIPERIAPLFNQSDMGMRIYQEGKDLLKVINDGFSKKYEDFWARAEAAGVGVKPEHTLHEAHKIKEEMLKRSPTGVDEALGLTEKQLDELFQDYSNFLDENIFKMEKFPPTGDVTYIRREQTFREMDGVAGALDRYALSLEGGKKKAIQAFNARLKQATLLDMKTNAFGPNANDFQLEMKALDENFSYVMSQFFETSTAKRFARVRRRGLRAIEFDEWTTTNVDQLARAVIETRSPEALKSLRKIVTPSTWRSIKAAVLYDALFPSTKRIPGLPEEHYRFNAEEFKRRIGFDSKTNPVRKTFEELFRKGNVTNKDIEDFIKVGEKISGLDIPNVSQFVARRAVLGGRGAIWSAFLVGSAGSAASGYETGGFWGLALNTLLFAGGARLLSATLANPLTARPFMKVMNSEASLVRKRATLMRIIRMGLEGAGYGIEGLEERSKELYGRAYPQELGEGNISEPVKEYYKGLLPTPGLTEEQLKKGAERRQKKEIDLVMAYADGYIDLGLGKTPEEPDIISEYDPYKPKPVYHTGGVVHNFSKLAANLDKMSDINRKNHLTKMFKENRKDFDRLFEFLDGNS